MGVWTVYLSLSLLSLALDWVAVGRKVREVNPVAGRAALRFLRLAVEDHNRGGLQHLRVPSFSTMFEMLKDTLGSIIYSLLPISYRAF